MWNKWSKKPWYPYAVAGCITVLAFVILMNIGSVFSGIGTFLGYFIPVFLGIAIAYMMNQLSLFYQAKLFSKIKNHTSRNIAGITLAAITILACIAGALILLIPQLIGSITTFAANLNNYEAAIRTFVQNGSFFSKETTARILEFMESSGGILEYITAYVVDHLNSILPAIANTGRSVVTWVIAFILAIYFLAGKHMLANGFKSLFHALFSEKKYNGIMYFLQRCNKILARFLVYNILDALIVGLANALFMLIANMNYIGLISFIVGLTNLIPTFGPIVGGFVGALLLFLVNPWHALAFIIFTICLQTCDGYLIKPKLFGNVLGVPGVWVLISVVVFGRALGVVGILLAIPAIAILDFIYKEYFMPWLKARRKKKDREAALICEDELNGDELKNKDVSADEPDTDEIKNTEKENSSADSSKPEEPKENN